MSTKTIGKMTSRQQLDAVDQALAEVSRRLEPGKLDGSGRYYTDEELATGTAMGIETGARTPRKRIA
jgi:hypothetical protein